MKFGYLKQFILVYLINTQWFNLYYSWHRKTEFTQQIPAYWPYPKSSFQRFQRANVLKGNKIPSKEKCQHHFVMSLLTTSRAPCDPAAVILKAAQLTLVFMAHTTSLTCAGGEGYALQKLPTNYISPKVQLLNIWRTLRLQTICIYHTGRGWNSREDTGKVPQLAGRHVSAGIGRHIFNPPNLFTNRSLKF